MKKIFLIFLLSFCLYRLSFSHAVPSFDASPAPEEVASVDNVTLTHVVSGGCANPILIANIYSYTGGANVSSVSTTAGAMTQLTSARICVDIGGSNFWCQDTWYRLGAT